jgi:hypothetical protein
MPDFLNRREQRKQSQANEHRKAMGERMNFGPVVVSASAMASQLPLAFPSPRT